MADATLRVEVVYATPGEQWLVALDVTVGATAADAVALSGVRERYPDLDASRIGVFGERVAPDRVLEDGDRVEIYRPLKADPKAVRREMAKLGKTMKRR